MRGHDFGWWHERVASAIAAAGNADSSPATRAWVVDSTPPVLSVTASPRILWPPDHRMVEVVLSVAASDNLGAVRVVLVSATSSEPDNGVGDGDTTNDIQSAEVGTLDTRVLLRAERSGVGPGRVYTLTYQATDLAGNTTTASVTIVVPHDRPLEKEMTIGGLAAAGPLSTPQARQRVAAP